MAQISITIPAEIEDLLNFLSLEQKRSKSELAAHALELGLSEYLESLIRRDVFKNLVDKRRAKESAASSETPPPHRNSPPPH